jgi:hypothetical protein
MTNEPMHDANQSLNVTLLENMVHEREHSVDRWRTRKVDSAKFFVSVHTRLRTRNIEHLDVRPVYLGHIAAYMDWPDLVTASSMRHRIIDDFRRMPAEDFVYHPLAPFFMPAADGAPGFITKTFTVNGRISTVFQIDHILPVHWNRDTNQKKICVL